MSISKTVYHCNEYVAVWIGDEGAQWNPNVQRWESAPFDGANMRATMFVLANGKGHYETSMYDIGDFTDVPFPASVDEVTEEWLDLVREKGKADINARKGK